MVEAARRVVEEGRPHAGLELVFTPKEEVGLRGRRGVRLRRGSPRASATSTTRPGRSARSCSARRTRRSWRSRSSAARRTPGWRRRRAAPRSPPRRARSPTCGSAGSTRRRSANVGTIEGGVARNIVPDRCIVQRRGALARRDEAGGGRPGDARRLLVRGVADRVRGRDARSSRGFKGYRFRKERRARAPRARGARADRATSPCTRSPAAAPTRTSSTCAASPASTSRTGWRRSTRPHEHIAVADLEAMVDVTLALLEEARAA